VRERDGERKKKRERDKKTDASRENTKCTGKYAQKQLAAEFEKDTGKG